MIPLPVPKSKIEIFPRENVRFFREMEWRILCPPIYDVPSINHIREVKETIRVR